MKKFGTVSGVVWGSAKLKLGFAISGGAPEPTAGPGLAAAGGGPGVPGFAPLGVGADGLLPWGLLEWGFGFGFGAGAGPVCVVEVVLVELELLELELEPEWDELELELEDVEPDELELELEELLGGGHDSDVLATGPGRFRDEIGVPGASWKYSVCPLARTTVTVQSAAEADGSATVPSTAKTAPAAIAATFSFGRLNNTWT